MLGDDHDAVTGKQAIKRLDRFQKWQGADVSKAIDFVQNDLLADLSFASIMAYYKCSLSASHDLVKKVRHHDSISEKLLPRNSQSADQ